MALRHSAAIEIKKAKGKGRGVFARRFIRRGEIIERVPVLVLAPLRSRIPRNGPVWRRTASIGVAAPWHLRLATGRSITTPTSPMLAMTTQAITPWFSRRSRTSHRAKRSPSITTQIRPTDRRLGSSKRPWNHRRRTVRMHEALQNLMLRPTGRFDGPAPTAWTGTQSWQTADLSEPTDLDRIPRRLHGDRGTGAGPHPCRTEPGKSPRLRRRSDRMTARNRNVKANPLKASPENSTVFKKSWPHAGLGSRRACEELILQGRVSVDGQVVRQLGTRVDAANARDHG